MSYISRADKLGVSLTTTSRIDVQNCKSHTVVLETLAEFKRPLLREVQKRALSQVC